MSLENLDKFFSDLTSGLHGLISNLSEGNLDELIQSKRRTTRIPHPQLHSDPKRDDINGEVRVNGFPVKWKRTWMSLHWTIIRSPQLSVEFFCFVSTNCSNKYPSWLDEIALLVDSEWMASRRDASRCSLSEVGWWEKDWKTSRFNSSIADDVCWEEGSRSFV